jgi:CheY-like chemotaxis protein
VQRGRGLKCPEASIFLLEDEALIRMMLAEMVEELGHRVVAEAGDTTIGRFSTRVPRATTTTR